MRTDVDHLPAAKQRELERIVEILFDEFGQATENATGRRKGARILKFILFGSHARGDHVDAPLSAMKRYEGAQFYLQKGYLKDAAFDLHQATERLYASLLLTLTYYTPYNHNIAFLRSLAEGLDRRLFGIWPESNRRERAMFQKLKEAYTKARYSKHYRISEEELAWLGERVEELGRVVHQVCTDKIAELEKAAHA